MLRPNPATEFGMLRLLMSILHGITLTLAPTCTYRDILHTFDFIVFEVYILNVYFF